MVSGDAKKNLWPRNTIFCIFLCRCCCNVKLPSYTFYGGNVVCARKNFVACVPVRFFSLPFIFTLLFARSSYFHSDGISCCSSKEIRLLFFPFLISLLALCRSSVLVELPQLSPTFSGSLSFSFSTFQICGHDNNLLI